MTTMGNSAFNDELICIQRMSTVYKVLYNLFPTGGLSYAIFDKNPDAERIASEILIIPDFYAGHINQWVKRYLERKFSTDNVLIAIRDIIKLRSEYAIYEMTASKFLENSRVFMGKML